MAYMNQDRKKVIAAALKPVLQKYGMKGSLSVRSHLAIVLTLTSGDLEFQGIEKNGGAVNPYWLETYFQGTELAFLKEAFQALQAAGWYDKSDPMTDYFHTAYYIDIQVGKWNKPYQVHSPSAEQQL